MSEPKDMGRYRYIHVHRVVVNQVNQNVPNEEILYDLTKLFRIFDDSTRTKILYVLSGSGVCICDIVQLLGMTQPAISYQLHSLEQSGLVRARREDETVFYSLTDGHVHTILDQGTEYVAELLPLYIP